jgi:hypothetical protein
LLFSSYFYVVVIVVVVVVVVSWLGLYIVIVCMKYLVILLGIVEIFLKNIFLKKKEEK